MQRPRTLRDIPEGLVGRTIVAVVYERATDVAGGVIGILKRMIFTDGLCLELRIEATSRGLAVVPRSVNIDDKPILFPDPNRKDPHS